MFSKSAALYDRIYGSFKDYSRESRKIHSLLQQEHRSARTLLDVACGSGEHARILNNKFGYKVDGIDLDADLIANAKDKNHDGTFCQGDMTDFNIGKTYDVVMCLFSSIGYVKILENVTASLQNFRDHLKEDGVILIEPWFQPGVLKPGKIFLNTVEDKELSVVRMAYNMVKDRISTLHFEYLIGTPGNISHEVEIHELGLFTIDEMKDCFQSVGLRVKYDEEGLTGRGLYISRKG